MLICMPTKEYGETRGWVLVQAMPFWATPRPIQGHISPSKTLLQKPREAQQHNNRWEPKLPSQSFCCCPKTSELVSRHKPNH